MAEVSSNHHTDLARCLAFVDRAAAVGCTAVKFQLFRVRQLFAPEILARSPAHRDRERWELPSAFVPVIADRCRQRRIAFGCTPFDLDAVTTLAPHVDFYKIASYELLWHDLLRACVRTGRPIVLSTGMATLDEVRAALDAVEAAGARDVTLLHCVSGYPTPPEAANLSALDTLRSEVASRPGVAWKLGWSDHTVNPAVVQRAVHRYGADMIEVHLDLDGRGDEYAAGHCWLPEPLAELAAQIRIGLAADGDGAKEPAACERPERAWRADPGD
ncbi:MAG: N-acetylneuraminate synthase family protein, partial [Proteobacteria bacterium]|nr:N-acetylneuraminate synthase family protein [Pseudomonadota bacterium]